MGWGPFRPVRSTTLGGGRCRGVAVPSFQSLPRLLGLPRSDSRNQGRRRRPRLGCLPGSEALPSGLALRTSGQMGGRRVMRTHPHLFPQPGARAQAPRCRGTACRKCYTERCTGPISGVCQRFPPGGGPGVVPGHGGHRWARGCVVKSATRATREPALPHPRRPAPHAQPMLPPSPQPPCPILPGQAPLPQVRSPCSPPTYPRPSWTPATAGWMRSSGNPPIPRHLQGDPGRGAGTGGSRCGRSSGPSGEEGTLAGTPGASPRCSSQGRTFPSGLEAGGDFDRCGRSVPAQSPAAASPESGSVRAQMSTFS